MNTEPLTRFWPLIHSIIQEFWSITEPSIEETAIRLNVPIELYYYSEFGLDLFSKEEFQKRDPYSNPLLFEKTFVTLNFKGWIEPLSDDKYKVTQRAREAAREIIQAGDRKLLPFELFTDIDLDRLTLLLKQIFMANEFTSSPVEKWALTARFHISDNNSPIVLQAREYLMDLFAYRDDCNYAASHPHFGQAGIIWSVLGSLCKNDIVTAEQLAETMSSRGYETSDYEVALQAAAQLGWAEQTQVPNTFHITQKGRELREHAEHLTNEFFYAPWSAMTEAELDELYRLLLKLRDQLNSFRKRK
jgi:hypothetical protein